MDDELRRFWKQQEALRKAMDPLRDIRKLIDPVGDAYKRAEIGSATIRTMREQEEQHKLLAGVVESYHKSGLTADVMMRIAEDADRQRKLLQGPIEEARRIGLLDQDSEIRRSMGQAIEAHQSYERLFRLPDTAETVRLAQEAAATGILSATYFANGGDLALTSKALQQRMELMQSPWLNIEHLDRSAAAFAEMQAIGRALSERPPFEEALATSLRSDLGDWRDLITPAPELLTDALRRSGFYLERGFNPALTDFPAPAFDESARLAGLGEPEPETEAADDEDGLARNNAAYDRLQRFEIAIRKFIDRAMRDAFGDSWMKRQLPRGMFEAWQEKKEKSLKAGEPERPLIEYADFTDYRAIIERKDNWNHVFKPIFGRAEDVRESFQRLFPVRIATMHARIITLDDEMLLMVETKRVLRAVAASS